MSARRGVRAIARGVSWKLRITAAVIGCGALSAGCLSSQEPSVMVQLPAAGSAQGASFDVASCPHYQSLGEMDRVCVIDNQGNVYGMTSLPSDFPVDPPYAVYFQFNPGYGPAAQDLDTTSDQPAIGVFASPYSLYTMPNHCCAEEEKPADRIPSQVGLAGNGGLLVAVTDAQPPGEQVAVSLSYPGLFKSQLNPCTLPSGGFCRFAGVGAFSARFYIGLAAP